MVSGKSASMTAAIALIAKIPEKHRLSERNPSFRGNAMIPEGGISNTAILSQQTGVLIQDLPVSVRLRQFHIDFITPACRNCLPVV
jgi:cytochrome c biogenesis protein